MTEKVKRFVQLRNYKARRLRKRQTEAEELLWSYLKNREIFKVKFRRQHSIGEFIADFYCKEAKLVIELDGEQHLNHQEYDQIRTKYLEERGIKVIRYWNDEVLKELETVLAEILSIVEVRTPHLPEIF